jgi:lysophospholipase L1-like esterase
MKMLRRLCLGVFAVIGAGGAAAQTAQGLPVTRLAVQARAGVSDLLCSPAPVKPSAPKVVDPDPQEPPDAQDVESLLGTLLPERETPPAGAVRGAWPQARPGQPLRVAIWGDSHLAAGFFTSELVRLLPWTGEQVATQFIGAHMNRPGVRLPLLRKGCISAHWKHEPAYADAGAAAAPGPALVSLSSSREGATLAWDVRSVSGQADKSQMRLLYQQTSEPVQLGIVVDDGAEQVLTLQGAPGPAVLELVGDAPLSVVRLRLLSGAFRWQGLQWPVPEPTRLQLDVFGYPGATVTAWQRAHAEALAPWWRDVSYDLVMLEFGTNEGNVQPFDAQAYAQTLRASVTAWRAQFPQAACVLIGPGDRGVLVRRSQKAKPAGRNAKGKHAQIHKSTKAPKSAKGKAAPVAKASTDLLRFTRVHQEIARLQNQVAAEQGCRFWGMLDAMDGAGGAYRWASQTPPLMARDLIHFTVPGYQRLAQRFAQDMGWQAERLWPDAR